MDEGITRAAAALPETDWTFGGRWPYRPRFFDTDDGRLAYYDEGQLDAMPVVLLHGNPSWSYLYRRVFSRLLDGGRRPIAVDHLGFGRSDKPARAEGHGVPEHAARLEALLESLDLCSATLVVHDWSGPIGLRWATRHPDRVNRLVVLNTFAPRLPGPMGARFVTRAVRTPGLGSLLARRRDVLTEQFLFKAGLADPTVLDELDREAYRAPHPDPASRTALLAFPREIPFRDRGPVAELSAENAEGLARHYTTKPVALVWGMKDILFGPEVLRLWGELLPHADVTSIENAGHFVQEDAPNDVIGALLNLVDDRSPSVPLPEPHRDVEP